MRVLLEEKISDINSLFNEKEKWPFQLLKTPYPSMTKMKEVNQKLFDKCKQHLEDNQKLQLEKETLQDRLQQLQLNFAERERELQVKHFFTLSSSTIISEPTDCNPGQADQCFNAKQVTVFTAE